MKPESHFFEMARLAAMGFNVVPGALGVIENGVFVPHFSYEFIPMEEVILTKPDGSTHFEPFAQPETDNQSTRNP